MRLNLAESISTKNFLRYGTRKLQQIKKEQKYFRHIK
jgi:hypothetical protein